ncbi:hypothetical protein RY27_12265 [Litorilinea aerophila]|nr:hypothetical protein RY27_12265 [Litorilinea aerophila]
MIQTLLRTVSHRPWPLPASPWVMRQTWHDLLFAHWPLPAATVQALVPPPLTVETFVGMAWVGVVPFRMSGVVPRGIPALPWLSAFPELNVRTYVTLAGEEAPRPGVYFFSLDAANPVAVAVARWLFRLPYFRARMRLEETEGIIHYHSHRTHRGAPNAEFVATYQATDGIYHSRPDTLEHWLTERYCLYTVDGQGRAYRGEIHHLPWPLQPAAADIQVNTMAAAAGLSLPAQPPLCHFARRLDVLVWPLTRIT